MTYAITHNDLDGVGCAILLEKVFPDIQIFSIDYRELNDLLPVVLAKAVNDKVFITDISLNGEQAVLCNNHGQVQHIDHHSSNKKISDAYDWSFTDTSHCATYHLFKMLSNYAHLEDYQDFVELVDNYDTWGQGTQPSEEAQDLNRLLKMIGAETFVARFKFSGSVELSETELAIIAVDRFQEEQYLKFALTRTQAMKDPDDHVFLLISAEQFTSSLGNYLLQQFPEADYVLILDTLRDKASLRSKGAVDVGELAKSCGGGGHKKAAGFQLNEAAVQSFWRCHSCELRKWWESRNTTLDNEVSEDNATSPSSDELTKLSE